MSFIDNEQQFFITTITDCITYLALMIPLTASFITRSMAHPTTSRSMTQVFALLPRATDDVTAVVSSQSSIPFTLMSAFAMAISYADR